MPTRHTRELLAARPAPSSATTQSFAARGRNQTLGGLVRYEFRPNWWLHAAFRVLCLVLGRAKFGKLTLAGIVWTVLPRRLKVFAWAFAGFMLLILAGVVSALVIVVEQLAS